MKNALPTVILVAGLLLLQPSASAADWTINFDPTDVANTTAEKPFGENISYLMASQEKWPRDVSVAARLEEMGLGIARFPYGNLANNYLWTTGDYSQAASGLKPHVTSKNRPPAGNSAMASWAVNRDGSFTKAMDFDEFIAAAQMHHFEPLVVVNVQGHLFHRCLTEDDMVAHAAHWVNYANNIKGYNVKYWQVGNEPSQHTDIMSTDEYIRVFERFATAMKAVDPSIQIGFAEHQHAGVLKKGLEKAGNLIDFMTPHQYLYKATWSSYSYAGWRDFDGDVAPRVKQLRNALANTSHPDVPFFITEMGVSPDNAWPEQANPPSGGELNDLYKSLIFAEMTFEMIAVSNVKYIFHWNTISPWSGETANGSLANSINNTPQAELTPVGQVLGLLGNGMRPVILNITPRQDRLRAVLSKDAATATYTAFVLNKGETSASVDFSRSGGVQLQLISAKQYSGSGPEDEHPVVQTLQSASATGNTVSVTAPPVSLCEIAFKDQ